MPVVNTSLGPVLESYFDETLVGINVTSWLTSTGLTQPPLYPFRVRRIHDAGLAWYGVEPSDGAFDFTKFDQVMRNLQAYGRYASYGFCFPAAWASASPGVSGPYGLGTKGPPASMEKWRRYVRTVIARYGHQFAYVEGWNEANLALYWNDTISNLVQWHNAMYDEVKALFPAMPVACYPPTALNSLSMPDNARLISDFAALGAKFDMITAHIYVNTALAMPAQIMQIQRMIADMAHIGRQFNMPVVLSEVGQQNWANLSESDREKYFKRSLMLCAAYGCQFVWYAHDVGATGDIQAQTRQQWWMDVVSAMNRRMVRLVSVGSDGTVNLLLDNTINYSF